MSIIIHQNSLIERLWVFNVNAPEILSAEYVQDALFFILFAL